MAEPPTTEVLDRITDGFFALDRHGRFAYVNRRAEEIFQRPREALLGQSVWALFPQAAERRVFDKYRQAIQERRPVHFEELLPVQERCIEVHLYPDAEGTSVFFRDITERKRAERERERAEAVLRESEDRFRSLAIATSQIVWTTSPTGESRGEQPGWGAFTGQGPEEYRGLGWLDAVHPEDRASTIEVWSAALRERRPYELEHRLRRRDGEYRHMWARGAPVLAADGRVREWVGMHADITEDKRLEEERDRAFAQAEKLAAELGTERARLQEIFTRAPALISVTRGPEHVFELVNPFYQRMVGGRELVGKPIREALPELAGQGFFEMCDALYATGETHVQNEARILADLDGDGHAEEHFLNFVTQPLRDAEGRVERLLTFAVEVTEQVRARRVVEEQAMELEAHTEELRSQATLLEETQAELEMANDELTAAEGRLRGIFDSALDAMTVTDTESVILEWNHHAETIFGWSAEEALGKRLSETIIPPQYREAHQKGIERYLATGEGPILNRRIEIPALRRDGREFPVELTVAPTRSGNRVLFTAFVRDITEQKEAERRLAAEHVVTRILAESRTLEAAAPGILRAIGEALGWEVGVFWVAEPAANALEFAGIWHAPDAPVAEFAAAKEQLRFTRGVGLPGRVWESGAPVWISDVTGDRNFPRITAAIQAGLHGAFAFPVQGGGEFLGVIEFFHREVRAPDPGLLAAVEAIGGDIGQSIKRVRAEEERDRALDAITHVNTALVERTAEAEAANRAKSDFLATMSHEIRTPINAIVGYTDLLEMGVAGPLTDKQRIHLERIRTSGEHLIGLIDDVLDLAKVESGRMDVAHERAPAMSAITAALALVRPQAAGKEIAIEDPCAEDEGTYYVADEHRVRQVLANLLSNAVKFTEPGGRITLTCGTTQEVPPQVRTAEEGPLTYVRVRDTGIGIAPEDMDRVFRPFTQAEQGLTRSRGGTGLGLTISRQLARLMGGDLTVESEPGDGSEFTLWLPSEAALAPPVAEAVLEVVREERPRGLVEAGAALREQIDSVLEAFVRRLAKDPLVPMAAGLGRPDLEDHAPVFLADVVQALVALGDRDTDGAALVRDGTEIQRVISNLHGAQRARLGWSEDALRREFQVLGEEVDAAVRRNAPSGSDVDDVLRLLARFLEHAERTSLRALRLAAAGGAT